MNKPHHTPHAALPAWPTVDTTPEADEPLTVLVQTKRPGEWTATATWAGITCSASAPGPCEAAQTARAELLLVLMTPEGER